MTLWYKGSDQNIFSFKSKVEKPLLLKAIQIHNDKKIKFELFSSKFDWSYKMLFNILVSRKDYWIQHFHNRCKRVFFMFVNCMQVQCTYVFPIKFQEEHSRFGISLCCVVLYTKKASKMLKRVWYKNIVTKWIMNVLFNQINDVLTL